MNDAAFVAGAFVATLIPAGLAAGLALRWRGGVLGLFLAVPLALLAAWLGLGLFVRLALGPDFMAPMMD